jgi:hypothetical protein
MSKILLRLTLFSLLALFTAGCWVFGLGGAVPAQPGGPPPGIPPTPGIPQIHLEHSGTSLTGAQSFYTWAANNGSSMGGGSAPGLPGTVLTLPAGSTVNVVVTLASPPAALWILELDSNGTPTKSSALTPAANVIPYTLAAPSGSLKLQVTAEWTYQNQVTYVFDLDVK